MRHLDLFSGIGGFALAAQRVWQDEYHNVGFCEIEDFCQRVLEKHWPLSAIFADIRELTRDRFTQDFGDPATDLLTGGFPCQPFSVAGKQRAERDDRYLWPEMLRVIKEFRPRWVIGENVAGIVKLALDHVLSDLEGQNYACQAFIIPACAVNAPHIRQRTWIVAHARSGRHGQQRKGLISPTNRSNQQDLCFWNTQPMPRRVAHGIPNRVDRLKALGNSIVPQVAEELMWAIRLTEEGETK